MFGEFWAAYPDRCPRKIDYDRCSRKHAEILAASADPCSLHRAMLNSLKRWDGSEIWNKEGGKFICAPYAWLDRRLWKDRPAQDTALAAKKAVASRTYKWTLCEERCANFKDGRCTMGIKVPPDQCEWPCPPQGCRHFLAAS